ncbi:MAG: BatD family protein [Planctomycetota bacterium]
MTGSGGVGSHAGLWQRAFAVIAVLAAGVSAQEVDARLDEQQVRVGDSVGYTVVVRGNKETEEPELAGFEDFDVAFHGARHLTSFVNGRMSSEQRFSYTLTPKKGGALTVPAVVVKIAGKLVRSQALLLTVLPPDDIDLVRAAISIEPETVYPLQPFVVTLRIFIQRLPGPMSDRDPLRVTRPPRLRVPWVDPIDGLESKSKAEWLRPLVVRQRGFSINDMTTQEFFDQRRLVFNLDGREATAADAAGSPRVKERVGEYWVYTLTREFTPVRRGEYSFGPARVRGTFADAVGKDKRLTGRDVYVIAPAVSVFVKDVPTKGRPASYTGGIGRFVVTADIEPKDARVGDPMTLTLTVLGRGNLDDIGPPDLEPELGELFRLYEATSATKESNKRVFTYGLRPRRAGIEAVPAVSFSFFDVEQGAYVTDTTTAIPIAVTAAETVSDGDIVSGATNGAGRSGLEETEKGIFANVSDAREVRDEGVAPVRTYAYLGGLLVIYIVAGAVLGRRRRLRGDPALVRRKRARARAKQRWSAARAAGETTELRQAVAGLVADVADVSESGLTGADVHAQLIALGADADLAVRAQSWFESCDAARYGGDADPDRVAEGERLLDDLIAALGRHLK